MELIISELIHFREFLQPETPVKYEYPEIQKLLNDGYSVKSLIPELIKGKDGKTSGIFITAILYKSL